MSLGGYKFAGRFCQKGSLTDAQWALKMHKTKVAAFMAANTLSGAGWDYDMTGSPDGNIHCLDTVGNNYVTVFKRTNGENDYTWFALYTLTKFTRSGTNSGAVKIYLYRVNVGSSQYYPGYYASSFYRIGTSQISYSDDLALNPLDFEDRTGLLPMGNPGASNLDISSSYYPPSNSSYTDSVNATRFGFAVKADCIAMFQGYGYGESYDLRAITACSVASGHAFSSVINDNDESGIFAYNTQKLYPDENDYEANARNIASLNMLSHLCAVVNGGTRKVNYSSFLGVVPMAAYFTSIENYPFQSICACNIGNSVTGVSGKGTILIDFLSVNFPGTNQGLVPNVYQSVANGKYLCINSITGTSYYSATSLNAGSFSVNAAMYVGWDPSNPDITQASAWTEYTE